MHFVEVVSLVLALGGSALSTANGTNGTATEQKRYAILDNDWESTGFLPILMGVNGGIEILGLASSTANTWQNQSAHHALASLEIGNLSCIPVYHGATHPLINSYNRFQAWQMIHGKLSWEGVFNPYNATAEDAGSDPTAGEDPNRVEKASFVEGFPNTTAVQGKSAASFMVEMVHKYPGQVSIFAAGAMTNVALAVRMDDMFARLAKELVIMGGYIDVNMYQATGSTNQADLNSDINLMIDPEASKIALTADFPNIIVVGNAANQVMPDQDYLDEISQVKNKYTDLLHEHLYLEFPFWDETAMGLLVDPSMNLNSSTVYLDVDISYGSPNYGNIHVYQQALMPPGIRGVTYVNRVDGDKLKKMIKNAAQYPKGCATQ